MSEELKIVISADAAQATDAIGQVNAALTTMPAVAAKAGTGVEKFHHTVTQGSQQSRFAVIELSHVLRDLPFAISNPAILAGPFDRLFQSFTALKGETGSTKGALAALGNSLTGASGLMVGFNILTTVVALFGGALLKSVASADAAKKANDDYAESTKKIISSLSDEAARVSVLVKAIESETLTKSQRKGAVDELKRINPEYFGQLNAEKGLIDTLTLAYRGYLQSLKSQFAAKALDKQISALFDKKLSLEIQLDPKISSVGDANLNQERNRITAELQKLPKVDLSKNIDITKLTPVQQHVLDLKRQLEAISGVRLFDLTDTSKALADINKQIEGLLARRVDFGDFGIKLPPVENIKPFMDAVHELKGLPAGLAGTTFSRGFSELVNLLPPINTGLATMNRELSQTPAKASPIGLMQIQLEKVVSVLDTVKPAFDAVFDSIITGGGNALAAFGQAIKSILAKLVAAVVEAAIFSAIINAIVPGAGSAFSFKSIFSQLSGLKLPGLQTGGIVTGPINAIIGEHGPEVVFPLNQLNRFLSGAGSGNGQQVFIADSRIEGDHIVQVYRRVTSRIGGTHT